jgi:MFS family permease
LLFSIDALGGSLVVNAFLAYWLSERFAADPALIGGLFLVAGVLAAASFPVAAWLAERIGLIATMVFSHIPANLFLIAMALSPSLPVAIVFFLARAALSSMDIPARQSYTMAVVDPDERTAAAGITALARSAAQVPGPGIGSLLLVPFGLGAPIIASGLLKIVYDVALFAMFRLHPAPEEEARRALAEAERSMPAAGSPPPSVDLDRPA